MANGDDGGSSFDPSVGQFTGFSTLSDPNDPMIDWASNVKPSDLLHFAHDPETAMDNLAAKGVPPPEHHYDGNGNVITADQAAQLDAQKGQQPPQEIMGDPSAGNLTSTGPEQRQMAEIQARRAVQGLQPPDYSQPGSALAFSGADVGSSVPPPDYTGGAGGWRGPGKPAPPVPEPPPQQPVPPFPRGPAQGSIIQRLHDAIFGPGGAQAAGGQPYGPQLPPKSQERPSAEGMGEETTGKGSRLPGQPTDLNPTEKGIADAQQQVDETNKKKAKALSDFGKAMQGIKIPERPKLPPLQSQGVRQAHPITPNAMNLLGLIGQGGVPSARPNLLAQLLGRIA